MRTRQAVPRAEQRDTGFTAGEPTMGIDEDGTLFYVGITFNGVGIPSSFPLRSKDGGRTWEEMDVLVPGTPADTLTLDPFMYVDRDTGRVFNVDLIMPCTPSRIRTTTERPGARARCATTPTTRTCSPGRRRPARRTRWVIPTSSTTARSTAAPRRLRHLHGLLALDGRREHVRPHRRAAIRERSGRRGREPRDRRALRWRDRPRRGGPDGTVYLPRGFCGQPYLAISTDMGDTWERVQVADNGFSVGRELEEHEANVAVDREGNVYYTWVALDRMPYLAVSRDGGRTFGKPIMIAPPGLNEAWDVFVEAGEPGRLALIYMGTTNSPGPPFCARTTANGCVNADGSDARPAGDWAETSWNGYMATTVTALAPNPTFFTTTVNDPEDELVRGECGPLRCQQEYDFLDVVIGPDGTPWASFVDGCPPDPDESCLPLGRGIVGHMTGGPPLVGPLPPPAQPAAAPPAREKAKKRKKAKKRRACAKKKKGKKRKACKRKRRKRS